MDQPGTSDSGCELPEECLVCERKAKCRNYGVITCNACKMFFRRMTIENLNYECKRDSDCFENPKISMIAKLMCRACRFRKCLSIGMEFAPRTTSMMEIKNRKDDEFTRLVDDLVAMDAGRVRKLFSFYTEDDLGLADILEGRTAKSMKKAEQLVISPDQWSFLSAYNLIRSFMKLDFVGKLSNLDKTVLFKSSIMRSQLLCSGIKTMKAGRNKLVNPDGAEVYDPQLGALFQSDPTILNRICCLVVTRMIELNMTNEEFVLLDLVFFCNPAVPSLSEDARSTLTTHQKMYTSSLLQYCQLKYQHNAPSRLADLLSLFNVVSKNYADLQYVMMMLQCCFPGFKFKKLAIDTLQLATNNNR